MSKVITSSSKISKLMELIFSEPNVYGNWTPLDFAYHFEGLNDAERIGFLTDIIAEGDDWIVE